MTYEDVIKVQEMLAEMHKKNVPDEERDKGGRLGFDYGYQFALHAVEMRLYGLIDLTVDLPKEPTTA